MAIQNKYSINDVYRSVFFAITLDTRKGTDIFPVAVRVTYNYKKIYIRTGLLLSREQFDKMLKSTKGNYYESRKEQLNIYERIIGIAKPLIDSGSFTLLLLKEKIKGYSANTINDLYRVKISDLKSNSRIKTAIYYECSINKFESYFGKNVSFSEITRELINDFKKKMEDEKLSTATISMYLRSVRTICNLAIYKGLLDHSKYPFMKEQYGPNNVKIPRGVKRKGYFLSIEEIQKLWSYNTEENKKSPTGKIVCEALNLWMFSYLANGMNFADIARLKYSTHYFKTKGRELSFIRKKTERTMANELVIYVPIIPELRKILDEYGTKAKKDSLVFPQILAGETDEVKIITIINQWNKNIAKRLMKVCEAVGIEDNVSMTWARHSYQTNLAHKKVPESYIDQAVGHADSSITDGYIGLYSTEDRFKYNSLLLEP